ncbi:acyl-CoA dehydratase activase [Desulfosporosinus youngiae]|uniref:Activator of 2-hydroxyglutaryl-CoA dehydratase (HSP70-class ATPase domain) n=1 Tax=Desulfosporosinus youngiae DSM 17734 TaxID=768710 RepID=H5Y4P6_9FIRM|nr:acyl-CoA dehydratase activase [Desulfosporosinus youngiae]EHQ89782.1 activator of 2-hydroxyglutaryl-CoA dehydratase (HSP70-class ATPase domain) [Desulfosporosinus youngiae DSM 17734]
MVHLGIDLGASSVKLVLLDKNKQLFYDRYVFHQGDVKGTLKKLLAEMLEVCSPEQIVSCGVTGNISGLLQKCRSLQVINEVAAVVEGSLILHSETASIIEIGAQTARFITDFSKTDKSRIRFFMNSDCSAGTGSFLEEQILRLNLKLENYSSYIEKAVSIPRIAGRCSVFAKTDIIHHQQEGVPIEDILLGLAYAVVKNYRGTVMKKLPLNKPVFFAGAVTRNLGIIKALHSVLGLSEADLLVHPKAEVAAAAGAAAVASTGSVPLDISELLQELTGRTVDLRAAPSTMVPLAGFGKPDYRNKHRCISTNFQEKPLQAYLGVDVGSTSINLIIMDLQKRVITSRYLKTLGKPIDVVREGLLDIYKELGSNVKILGAGVTGSGRYLIGRLIGADVVKDEITAQARAAMTLNPEVDTIFEIGGQDSKYIRIDNGVVTDFEMNKICAAGTGSFIEEQAKKLQIPIEKLGDLALASEHPANLGERCTVFIESNISAALSHGTGMEDIASGLCYSIVRNYLDKVVGQKHIGNTIFFQGGVGHNPGVVNAFKSILGKDILLPDHFSVTGALGAAILTMEEKSEGPTLFKGLALKREPLPAAPNVNNKDGDAPHTLNRMEALYLQNYDGPADKTKKTVGIPRVLFLHKLFPMFNVFFKELGYNVRLSDTTGEEVIRLSQQFSIEETCYPVKLIHGHVAWLAERGVDYIFLPALYTMKHAVSKTRQDYACVYMQTSPKIIEKTMELKNKGIKLLSPSLSFKFGKTYMLKTLIALGKDLGKNPVLTLSAAAKGMAAFKKYEEDMEAVGTEFSSSLKPGEKAFVLISRPYNIADPALNMKIPEKLREMGYKVLTLSMLPAHNHDLFSEYPNMYWPFGQHILSGAQIVRQHPSLFAIYITSHGCGPDTLLSQYFQQEMQGKPYLHIEVDEHSSSVGVITRLEAFVSSLKQYPVPAEKLEDLKVYSDKVIHQAVRTPTSIAQLKQESTVYLPYLYPYSAILAQLLIREGTRAKILPMTSETSLARGRAFTRTKEYFTLTTLLGDVFTTLEETPQQHPTAFLIPTNEGTEAEGQYNRLLQMKLEQAGYPDVEVISPFIEDIPSKVPEKVQPWLMGLLAGDLVMAATPEQRSHYLREVLSFIGGSENLTFRHLENLAERIVTERNRVPAEKRVYVLGDPAILFNDFMNDHSIRFMEQKVEILHQPLSEWLWFIWKDSCAQGKKTGAYRKNLDLARDAIQRLSQTLGSYSPYEQNLNTLVKTADEHLNYFAGANGRYRLAKLKAVSGRVQGLVTAASMYDNTGIILSILQKDLNNRDSKPILDLTFDGNQSQSLSMKIQSFLYYL